MHTPFTRCMPAPLIIAFLQGLSCLFGRSTHRRRRPLIWIKQQLVDAKLTRVAAGEANSLV
jgi:hypothetical protein